jgi:serine/threonine protein kinase
MSFRRITGSDPDYTKLKKLGKGAFGSVYKVRRKTDGKVREDVPRANGGVNLSPRAVQEGELANTVNRLRFWPASPSS